MIYPYITRLGGGAVIPASLEKVFEVKEVEPTCRLAVLTALAFLAALGRVAGTAPPSVVVGAAFP